MKRWTKERSQQGKNWSVNEQDMTYLSVKEWGKQKLEADSYDTFT